VNFFAEGHSTRPSVQRPPDRSGMSAGFWRSGSPGKLTAMKGDSRAGYLIRESAPYAVGDSLALTRATWAALQLPRSPGANVSGTKASAVALAFNFAQLRA
jgi:hypothetical protein